MNVMVGLLVIFLAGITAIVWFVLRSRNLHIWIVPYLASQVRKLFRPGVKKKKVYFCFVDHYEPYILNDDDDLARRRVQRWCESYPPIADRHADSSGRRPVHSFFYPEEEYKDYHLYPLAELCKAGYGDVEIHLHHDNDTADGLKAKINSFKDILFARHGLLRRDPETGEIIYAFIHGNWALDNSRPDGRWCGVDNEIEVLVDTGCYMDMTMPSAPSDTQTSKINSIYWARGRPGKRKSHNRGRDVTVGEWGKPGELLLLQGPLTLNWRNRKWMVMPKIESAEISYDSPPSEHRVELWESAGVTVKGCNDHLFIKVHTHGALDKNADMLFGGGFETLWGALERRFRDREGYELYYVTAWEMYQKVKELAVGDQPPRHPGVVR